MISSHDIILEIDASDHVFEIMILQRDDDEILYFIIFYNQKFNIIKLNYEIYDKKIFIIIEIMNK